MGAGGGALSGIRMSAANTGATVVSAINPPPRKVEVFMTPPGS
jgi:hypothetical protein